MVAMTNAGRSYVKEFGGAMAAYVIVLPISITVLEANPGGWWRVPMALAPVVPAIFMVWAFVRFLGRIDELQRRIHFEALALAFGGTALLTFSYGFLENAGFPHLSMIWVLPLMAALWGLSAALASRRYR